MDQGLWLKSVFTHGNPLLSACVSDAPLDVANSSRKQKMFNFIKKKRHLLFQEKPPVFQKPFSFNPLPLELFWECSEEQRRKLFFKNLERGDVLILKVINDSLPENYKLQVLAKHQCCMKLDDLSLVMYLPKLESEKSGGLNNYDVIRAALWACSIPELKLFVTLSISFNEGADDEEEKTEEPVKLGKISIDELPSYVGDIQIQHPSFKSFYHQSSAFKNPNWSDQLYDVLGFQRKKFYSFFEEWDGKEYPVPECGKYLKKKHLLMLSNSHYAKAVGYYQDQNFAKAIESLDLAIGIYPQNKRALVSRGTLHANLNNLRKAFCDTEKALKIDPKYEPAQKQMSVILVAAAKAHIEKEDFGSARESLTAALGLDENNQEAVSELAKLEITEKEHKSKPPAPEILEISSSDDSDVSTVSKTKKKKKKSSRHRKKSSRRRSRSRSRSHSRSRSVSVLSSRPKSPRLLSVVTKPNK